ncbi:innexin unc-7 [Patella vulgata]|uniref:innexin unc-7 n=1 Tax=Patella vulgata TaxID=6465 RepID=UPI0021801F7A|nr:innexin unc-7 [Patella vulgata]XP_055957980.1 innexin unc-7 [Patella vulgata]
MMVLSFAGGKRRSNNFTDDFNYFWSVIFIAIPAVFFIAVRTLFVRSAITCYIPAHMTNSHAYFIHQACWLNDKYQPILDTTPTTDDKLISDEPRVTSPHDWIPFMLFIMLLLFSIPQGLRHVAKRYFNPNRSTHDRKITEGGKHVAAEIAETIFDSASQNTQTFCLLIIKVMILVNLVLHFLFIKFHFRDQSRAATYNTSANGVVDISYTDEGFPKTVLCETYVQIHSTRQVYTLMCTIAINSVYENYFVLLSLWFAFAAILSLIGFVCYVTFCCYGTYTKTVLSQYVPKEDLDTILKKVQRTDGLFQLWRLCRNEDASLVRDVSQLLREIIRTTPSARYESEEPAGDNSIRPPEIIIETPVEQFEVEEPSKLEV